VGPNQVFDLPPRHVNWVEGNQELVMVDWAGGAGFDTQPGSETRVSATILFTDIVDSTWRASEVGDTSWKRAVTMHDDVVRSVLAGFGGREVETAGDSFLVVFDGAESAVRCGLALVKALAAIEHPIRSASTPASWSSALTTSGALRYTLRRASSPRREPARCSYLVPRAKSPRAPRD
jgi:class 3 adenylate cyclase